MESHREKGTVDKESRRGSIQGWAWERRCFPWGRAWVTPLSFHCPYTWWKLVFVDVIIWLMLSIYENQLHQRRPCLCFNSPQCLEQCPVYCRHPTNICWILLFIVQFSRSVVSDWLFVTPWTAACQASLSITYSWSLLRLMSVESVMPSNHLILCRPLLQPSIFPSIRVFSNESALHIRWPK